MFVVIAEVVGELPAHDQLIEKLCMIPAESHYPQGCHLSRDLAEVEIRREAGLSVFCRVVALICVPVQAH